MTHTAVIIAIIAIIAFILYSVKDILTKPEGALNQRILKWFQIRDFFIMGHLLASWLIVALAGYIYNISIGEINEPILYAIFITSLWVTIAFNILYLYVYSLFRITYSFERANLKIKFNGARK